MKKAVFTRRSTRTYTSESLTTADQDKISAYLSTPTNLIGIHGNTIQINCIDVGDKHDLSKIGTYGVIKGVSTFAITICQNTPEYMLDCGYVFEKFVLFLETLGIGTCWLGGTFNRKQLSSSIALNTDEFIPIVSPIGYKSSQKSITEKVVRRLSKGNARKDFDELFSYKRFGNSISDTQTRELLEYVRVAPSASNKQPWRIIFDDDAYHFYIERSPNYIGNKLGYDIQMIDIGIALCHFEIAYGDVSFTVDDPHHTTVSPHRSYVISAKV